MRRVPTPAHRRRSCMTRFALPSSWSSSSTRRICSLVIAVSLLLVGTPLFVAASSAVTTSDSAASSVTGDPALPFDLSRSALQASPRKVFAHYLPSLTVSLDNAEPSVDYYTRNYLNP